MTSIRLAFLAALFAVGIAAPAAAQTSARIGVLECDVSRGIGLFLVQKQSLICSFRPEGGGAEDKYTGQIVDYGVAIGQVSAGHLVWGVLAASSGLPKGALAGSYGGVGAQASVGAGVGANVLVGGTGRAFSLQPLSLEGQTGVNIAAGITTVTLTAVP